MRSLGIPAPNNEKQRLTISTCVTITQENTMTREVGLWIDHRKSVIVTFVNGSEMTREIRSNIEKHVRFSSGAQEKASLLPHQATAEDLRDRKFTDHLGKYYEGVILSIRDADAIWIFGPGEAKVELGKQLERENLGRRIVGIDSMARMTSRQVAAKVREHYLI
jgi:hypothetical protein